MFARGPPRFHVPGRQAVCREAVLVNKQARSLCRTCMTDVVDVKYRHAKFVMACAHEARGGGGGFGPTELLSVHAQR